MRFRGPQGWPTFAILWTPAVCSNVTSGRGCYSLFLGLLSLGCQRTHVWESGRVCSPRSWSKARGQGKQEIEAGWTSGHRGWVRGSVQLEELEWLLGWRECVSGMHKAFLSSAFGTKQGFPKPWGCLGYRSLLGGTNMASFSMHKGWQLLTKAYRINTQKRCP